MYVFEINTIRLLSKRIKDPALIKESEQQY